VFLLVHVGETRDAIFDGDRRAADQSAGGLGKQQIAAQIFGQPVAGEYGRTAGGGEVVEGVVGTKLKPPTACVRHPCDRPHSFVFTAQLIRSFELFVENVLLEVDGS
jgi:hypothetical protein